MNPELYMREEKGAVDVFAAYMNVNSMQATESNFADLRKIIDRAEKRLVKESRMKKWQGVSVGRHPYFQKRGSFDGEKMVVALRIDVSDKHYQDVVRFLKGLGFKSKAMAVASTTNNHGRIEEFGDIPRATTHYSVAEVVKGEVENMEEVVRNRGLMASRVAIKFAAARGPVWDALEKDWNILHDIENRLDYAAHEYDVASSYRGKPGEKDAKAMLKEINDTIKAIRELSDKQFSKLVNMEMFFVKKFGLPDDYAAKVRAEIFPI